MSNFTPTITTKTTERPPRPPRTFLYGIHGIGKTTFLAQATNPIGIRTERGLEMFDVPQFPEVESWNDIFDCLNAIATSQTRYDTLIFDTIDHAIHLAVADTLATVYGGSVKEFENFGAGYKDVFQKTRLLLNRLEDFNNAGMQILISGHETIKTKSNPDGADYDKYQPSLPDGRNTNICNLVQEWCDMVLFATRQLIVSKDGKKDKKGKAKSSGHVIHSKPNAPWDSKVGAGFMLPDTFDLDYRIYEQYVFGGQPIPVESEVDSEQTVINV